MERRLAAILISDIVGYSKLMGADEAGTLAALRQLRGELFEPVVAAHRGTVIKRMGDGWLVEFASAVDAVGNAIAVQEGLAQHANIKLRIGIHVGDIMHEDEDIFGDGVNIAARLQEIAVPGGIALSEMARNSLDGKIAAAFADQGERQLKNITEAVRVFASGGGLEGTPVKSDSQPSIAVMPFENRSADPEQEYFADGITEDVITELARFRDFKIIAPNTVFSYKGQRIDVAKVAAELDVRYIIQGSVHKAGERVRVSAQLLEAATNENLWAERYDRDLVDIFDLQDEITQAIVRAVAPRSGEAEFRRAATLTSRDLGLWDTIAKVRYLLYQFSKEPWEEALSMLQLAIQDYPEEATLHSMLCNLLFLQLPLGWAGDHEESLEQANAAAREALRLDSQDAYSHRAMSLIRMFQGRFDEAITSIEIALKLNPNSAEVLGSAAGVYGVFNDYDRSSELLRRAGDLSPNDPARPIWNLGLVLSAFMAARYDDAIATCTISIEMNPNFPSAYRQRAAVLALSDRLDEARRDVAKLLELEPNTNLRETAQRVPLRGEHMEIFLDGLRAAGLPE